MEQQIERSVLRCPNCASAFEGRFCPQCGQRYGVGMPGVLDYLREILSDYVAMDGKLWRTLWLLVAYPGLLSLEYLAGRRQRYIGPMRLYLSCSVVFFLAISLSPNVRIDTSTPLSETERAEVQESLREAPEQLRGSIEALIDDARTVGKSEGATINAAGPRVAEQIGESLRNYGPQAMFLMLPAFAALTLFFFRASAFAYAAHLLFALHAHAMVYLLMTLQLALPSVVADKLGILMPLWLLLALRRVFGGNWWTLALRTLVLGSLYLLLLSMLIVSMVATLALSLV